MYDCDSFSNNICNRPKWSARQISVVPTKYMAKLYLHTNSSLRNRDMQIVSYIKLYQFPRISPLHSLPLSFDLIHQHTAKSSQGVSQVDTVIQKGCYCNQIIQV